MNIITLIALTLTLAVGALKSHQRVGRPVKRAEANIDTVVAVLFAAALILSYFGH